MYKHFHKRKGLLAPDAEMWQALHEGDLLSAILADFYAQVYADPRLTPFFHGVTIERLIEKQFSFLRSIFTGEKCYFGNHPKSAHHWMVISDELFDYREALMQNTLRKHGLPEFLIKRWREMEELFRTAIVKEQPLPRKVGNFEAPADGYASISLELSTLCDDCGDEIMAGIATIYHRRTGKILCGKCLKNEPAKVQPMQVIN